VSVKLTRDAAGKSVAARVLGTAIEEVVGSCPHAAIPPNPHVYTLTSPGADTVFAATPGQNVPGVANDPPAALTVTVKASGPASTEAVTLRWRRNDFGPPLDWTITAQVPLTKKL
jgi:hypothetical protein